MRSESCLSAKVLSNHSNGHSILRDENIDFKRVLKFHDDKIDHHFSIINDINKNIREIGDKIAQMPKAFEKMNSSMENLDVNQKITARPQYASLIGKDDVYRQPPRSIRPQHDKKHFKSVHDRFKPTHDKVKLYIAVNNTQTHTWTIKEQRTVFRKLRSITIKYCW